MRIVFEGLPGAGKSTLAAAVAQWLTCPLVPEWAGYTEQDWQRFPFSLPHYQANDELKEQMARLCAGPVVMDRHYQGGLAYSYAQGSELHEQAMAWYRAALAADRLRAPGLLIYLRVEPELSLRRQPRAAAHLPFACCENLRRVEAFYRKLAREIEPETPRLELDGALPEAELLARITTALADLGAAARAIAPSPPRGQS